MTSLDEVSLEIGRLQAQTAQLLTHALDHERETRVIRQELATVAAKVDGVKRDVATVMPVVRRVQNWHQRAIGMSLVGGAVGSVVTVFARFKGWIG